MVEKIGAGQPKIARRQFFQIPHRALRAEHERVLAPSDGIGSWAVFYSQGGSRPSEHAFATISVWYETKEGGYYHSANFALCAWWAVLSCLCGRPRHGPL